MEFVEPPPSKKGAMSAGWIDKVARMKAQQGEWANVGNYSPGVATHLRRGKYPAFLEGFAGDDEEIESYMAAHWEITTRKTDEGHRNDVYIRWVG
jgi:hypothetical protein